VQQRLRDLLRRVGLREEEIALYVHLLRLKHATATQLIAASGLNTMTVYRTIKRLRDRGLLQAQSINNKQSLFAPLPLSAIIQKLGTEQMVLRKLQLALKDLDPLLPYLDVAQQLEEEAQPIELREGLDAFREEYMKLPDLCTDEYLCMGSMQNYWKVAAMSDESPEELAFRHKRYGHGISCRVFNTHSVESESFAKRDSKEMRTTRLVDVIPIRNDYVGYTATQIAHFICDEAHPRVIVIRHPELCTLYRQQFNDLWRSGVGA